MKLNRLSAWGLAAALMLTACGQHDHDHDHDGHEHDTDLHDEHSHHHDHEHDHSHGHEAEEEAHTHEEGVIHFTQEQARMSGLSTEVIHRGNFAEVMRVSGQVLAAQGDEAAIVAKTSGVVNFMRDHLSEGSEVRQGEILARVSAEGIAGGDLLAQNQLTLDNARAAYERAERLVKDSIISQKEFERTRLEYESARLAAEAGQGGRGGASVCSPLKGYIRQVLVRQGEYVEAGQVLATVTKNCNLQLRAEVPEKHFARLSHVRSANFKMGYDQVARSLDEMNGHLVAVGRSAADGSAYIPVTFEFANKGDLVPGSFADIWLIMNQRPDVLSIPLSALSESQGIFYAYTRHDGEVEDYERHELRLGASDGRRVEVLSGLDDGDDVVITGVSQLRMAGNTGVIPEAHNHSH